MRTQRKAAGERVNYERRCQVLSCIHRRGWATQTQSWKWNEDLLTYWVVYGSSFCVITFESRARWELMWCKLLSPSDSSWQHDRNSFGQGIIRFVANARLHMFTSLTTTNNLEKLSRLFFTQDSPNFFFKIKRLKDVCYSVFHLTLKVSGRISCLYIDCPTAPFKTET